MCFSPRPVERKHGRRHQSLEMLRGVPDNERGDRVSVTDERKGRCRAVLQRSVPIDGDRRVSERRSANQRNGQSDGQCGGCTRDQEHNRVAPSPAGRHDNDGRRHDSGNDGEPRVANREHEAQSPAKLLELSKDDPARRLSRQETVRCGRSHDRLSDKYR